MHVSIDCYSTFVRNNVFAPASLPYLAKARGSLPSPPHPFDVKLQHFPSPPSRLLLLVRVSIHFSIFDIEMLQFPPSLFLVHGVVSSSSFLKLALTRQWRFTATPMNTLDRCLGVLLIRSSHLHLRCLAPCSVLGASCAAMVFGSLLPIHGLSTLYAPSCSSH